MDKQALVKHTQWKVLNIQVVILKEELFPDQWNRFSSTLKMFDEELLSWSEHLTYKFTMK